ncbi:MAG: hypothetical protein P4L22_00445 [Candidatus Babeliales bacterium]|nr:hypothetical protein [Candidatus Babeliales bacterium]
MLRIISCLFSLLVFFTQAEKVNFDEAEIVYSSKEMQEFKRKCKEEMSSSSQNHQDGSYQMERALKTVSGDDADYIPKVAGAGEIFNNGTDSYQLMHNGVKVILNSYYDVKWLTDVIFALKGHHEPQEEKCFYEVLKYMPENATMIELGSYWAYYSLWFASQIKNANNYLIEPDPKRLEIGRKNFELNNKTGIFKRGFLGIAKDPEPDINGADYISIDDFIEKEGIKHVNILHADIQGAESQMLETTVKHLDKIDYFFISTHEYDNDHLPCIKFFKKHEFIIVAEHAHYESCSGDGLIVAKRKGVAGPDHISISKY